VLSRIGRGQLELLLKSSLGLFLIIGLNLDIEKRWCFDGHDGTKEFRCMDTFDLYKFFCTNILGLELIKLDTEGLALSLK
jgi:hypothetical protein